MSNLSAFALAPVSDLLTGFANRDDFWGLFGTAFGTQYDSGVAERFRSQWLAGDFGDFPEVEVVSQSVLGSANGAYAASTNRIYLSDRFVGTASSQSLIAVFLEEYGHFVDAQVNQVDTPGDEGEWFSALVRGISLSATELNRIQAEDDHAVVIIDGESIAVEQATTLVGSWDPLSDVNAVTVVGNYAYAVGDGLNIIDISNPALPTLKGSYYTSSYAYDVQVVGNYAYILNSGLQIIDISNPALPTLKGN